MTQADIQECFEICHAIFSSGGEDIRIIIIIQNH